MTILDFEKIVAEIAPETTIQLSEIDRLGHRERRDSPIMVAEDSVAYGMSEINEEKRQK